MSGFGDFSPFPFDFGDDPSPEEAIYGMLRRAGGDGFASEDTIEVTTIDGLWYAAQAAGLSAIESVEEAAHWQGFPLTATDELATYERILGITPPVGAALEERRVEVIERWTLTIGADYPSIRLAVFPGIDPAGISQVVDPSHTQAGTIIHGKIYDAIGAPASFAGGTRCSLFPNFSDDHVVTAIVMGGGPVLPEGLVGRLKQEIEEHLDEQLPAWNDFRVVTDVPFGGFTLDSSLLDVTGFGA